MRVALDVTPAMTGATGVARYTREMHRELSGLDVQVAAFAIGRGPHAAPVGTRHIGVPLRAVQSFWRLTGQPTVERLVGRVDIAHTLDLQPAPSRCPQVMTAHDLLAISHPHLHSPGQVRQQLAQLQGFRAADLVLADSYVTAQALLDNGVAAARLRVAPLGYRPSPEPVTPAPGTYLLAIGELAARKNLLVLIEAFRAARIPEDYELLLVGPTGYGSEEVLAHVGGRVRHLGRVDDAHLASLLAGATLFCFPSLAEGFGLPVLEAMGAGTPVLASDLDVLREVAGPCARYAPPQDVEAWTSAIEELLTDPAMRESMSRTGLEAAHGRTWRATAEATVAAYREVLA
jgi:glycosyltransferase involved in cell wall biosynthesis